MPLARLPELTKDDLYRLGFVCLDAQSTTRKMVDQLLARSGLDVGRLKIEMELNSFEAIKNAVQIGLGAAFLPVVSIERELAAGSLAPSQCGRPAGAAPAEADHPSRPLLLAGRRMPSARRVLPVFASPDSPLRRPRCRTSRQRHRSPAQSCRTSDLTVQN
jgi:DNA-binding transcriptional LysR family regulator